MRVIVCGAGQVGWQIARHLSQEGNDVTMIDNNPTLIRQATESMDVRGFVGFASYPAVLRRAGAEDADMIVAATHSDEVNMVVCQIAHTIFKINRKIARLRAQSYLEAMNADLYRRDHMPIDVVISPEIEVAKAALRRLWLGSAFDSEEFLGNSVQLLGLHLTEDCPVINTPLRQLTDLFSTLRAIVVAVRRGRKLIVPSANDQLFAGDDVYVMSHTDDVNRTLEVFGKKDEMPKRVVVIGGGNVGFSLLQQLEAVKDKLRLRVIELDRPRAETIAEQLERTIVLHGDALDPAIMDEAGVSTADAILTLTDDDKTNILAAVQAVSIGSKRAISLVNDPSLIPLLGPLGVNAHINPRATTVSSILRHVRHGRVRGVYSIGDSEAEMIEAEVLTNSPMAGKLIRDVEFPEGVMVGAVRKAQSTTIPNGDTLLEAGDSLVLFALKEDVPTVDRLLQAPIEFF